MLRRSPSWRGAVPWLSTTQGDRRKVAAGVERVSAARSPVPNARPKTGGFPPERKIAEGWMKIGWMYCVARALQVSASEKAVHQPSYRGNGRYPVNIPEIKSPRLGIAAALGVTSMHQRRPLTSPI